MEQLRDRLRVNGDASYDLARTTLILTFVAVIVITALLITPAISARSTHRPESTVVSTRATSPGRQQQHRPAKDCNPNANPRSAVACPP